MAAELTPNTKIKDWLAHPQGGPVLRQMLADNGQDASVFKPVQGFAIKRLVKLSKGKFTDQMIDDLIAKAEAYEPTDEDLAAAASDEASDQGDDEDIELPEWSEVITKDRFKDKTVIVTGAGSGIGYATASRVAREGGRVIAVDISAQRLEQFAKDHKKFDVTTVTADVTKQADIDAVMAAAGDTVDCLANVAGIMDNMTGLHDVPDDVWQRVFAVNVEGLMRLTRAVLPGMIEARSGSVVNVGSEAGLRGPAAGVAYTASKHAVAGMTKSAAFMYWPYGVRVNLVAPGGVATNIEASFDSPLAAGRIRKALAIMPPPTESEALAASITFLLSDDGVNVTGAIMPSDGGWSAT